MGTAEKDGMVIDEIQIYLGIGTEEKVYIGTEEKAIGERMGTDEK